TPPALKTVYPTDTTIRRMPPNCCIVSFRTCPPTDNEKAIYPSSARFPAGSSIPVRHRIVFAGGSHHPTCQPYSQGVRRLLGCSRRRELCVFGHRSVVWGFYLRHLESGRAHAGGALRGFGISKEDGRNSGQEWNWVFCLRFGRWHPHCEPFRSHPSDLDHPDYLCRGGLR